MAINAYTGLMGHGKSYEVVENIILPGLLSGRRVVTNVANLQKDEISAYLVESCGGKLENLGEVVQVLNDDIGKPGFFPVEVKEGEEPVPSVVQPGDLVVIDECWRWWASGCKIDQSHMVFFRMHRHFVNPETKHSCDLVLVVQDITDMDRKLKVLVENTYRMTKHKALGTSKRYRVDLYASYRTNKAPYRTFQRSYKKEIFVLYQSYSQAGGESGKEVAIDDRANIFKGPMIWLGGLGVLIMMVLCIWGVYRFFNPAPKMPPADKATVSSTGEPANISRAGDSPAAAPGAPAPTVKAVESPWQIIGNYQSGTNRYVVLKRAGTTRTLINPQGFYYDALRVTGSLDGELLTNYTGMANSSTPLDFSK